LLLERKGQKKNEERQFEVSEMLPGSGKAKIQQLSGVQPADQGSRKNLLPVYSRKGKAEFWRGETPSPQLAVKCPGGVCQSSGRFQDK
jgi:hypothetical protein